MVMALKLIRQFKIQYALKGDKTKLAEVTKMEKRILKWLKAGYEKLISFETTTKGYEWFGTTPGHEALTSYGLGQFAEMRNLTDFVDDGTITRNTDWLLSRRKDDGSGSFKLNPKALDTFGRAS
jgi:alpha-2-macroglobulin-like protein